MKLKIFSMLLVLSVVFSTLVFNVSADTTITLKGDYVQILATECTDDSELTYSYGWALMVGKSVTYRIDCKEAGKFLLNFNYRTQSSQCNVAVTVNGTQLVRVSLPSAGGEAADKILTQVELQQGENTVTLTGGGYGVNFESISLERVGSQNSGFKDKSAAYVNHFLPTMIEAEYFDYGDKGYYIAFDGVDVEPNFRDDAVIALDKTSDGYTVPLSENDWLSYTVYADYASHYAVYAGMNGMAKINTYVDGELVSVNEVEPIDGTGYLCAVYLTQGEHTLKFEVASGTTSVDYWKIKTAQSEDVKSDAEISVLKEFYVSENGNDTNDGSEQAPFKTLKAAKEAAAKINHDMTGDIVVNIMPGYHQMTETLAFTTEDSGKNGYRVIYRGVGKEKPLISGGQKVTGWEKHNDYIYKAGLPEVEDLRQFYVNGFAAVRARSKYRYSADAFFHKEGSDYESDGMIVHDIYFPTLANHDGIEMVFTREWSNKHVALNGVYSAEAGAYVLEAKQPEWSQCHQKDSGMSGPALGAGFYLENAFELLDEPGEFYFDKENKVLYYYPCEEESLDTAECFVGTVDGMITMNGNNINEKIGGISFENLEFAYGTWLYPNENGFCNTQSLQYYVAEGDGFKSRSVSGQILVNMGKNIQITDCDFRNLGSAAIHFNDTVSNASVSGCTFRDISSSAIAVDDQANCYGVAEGHAFCQNINITNNVITRVGLDYMGSAAIQVGCAGNTRIVHNVIKDVTYDGISCGYGWNVQHDGFGDNYILNNRIENVLTNQTDGAHIYCLGRQPGTLVRGNHLIKSGDTRGGLYFDDYSAFITAEENVIEDCDRWLYLWRPTVRDHVVKNNYTDTENLRNDGSNNTITNNTVVKDGNWPEVAVTIMDNAGVEEKYRDSLEMMTIPSWKQTPPEMTSYTKFISNFGERIYMADYDKGGEGVGYHDTDAKNDGGQYREDGVDIWNSSTISGRYDVGLNDGEWLHFTKEFKTGGDFYVRAWSCNSNEEIVPQLDILLDGEILFENIPVVKTSGSSVYVYTNFGEANIAPGQHSVKLLNKNAFTGITYVEFIPMKDGQVLLDEKYDDGKIVLSEELPDFTDCIGHWAEETILTLRDAGYIKGTTDTTFSPEANVTKGQACLLALRALNREDDLALAQELGLVANLENMDSPVTREEYATIMMKAYQSRNGSFTVSYGKTAFTDGADISANYEKYLLGAAELGLLTGYEDGSIKPQNLLTRAEAATVLSRLLGIL